MPPVDWTPLYPALTTAGSALAGVLLTLFIQSALSARQRKHERQGRAFDMRFEVYADYLHHTEALARVRADLNESIERMKLTLELRKGVRDLTEELAAAEDRVEMDKKEENVEALKVEKRKAEVKLASAERSIKLNEEKLDADREIGKRYVDKLVLLKCQIEILGDPPTIAATAAIMSKAAREEIPTTAERLDFIHAARRELALDRRRWPTRAWRWTERKFANSR